MPFFKEMNELGASLLLHTVTMTASSALCLYDPSLLGFSATRGSEFATVLATFSGALALLGAAFITPGKALGGINTIDDKRKDALLTGGQGAMSLRRVSTAFSLLHLYIAVSSGIAGNYVVAAVSGVVFVMFVVAEVKLQAFSQLMKDFMFPSESGFALQRPVLALFVYLPQIVMCFVICAMMIIWPTEVAALMGGLDANIPLQSGIGAVQGAMGILGLLFLPAAAQNWDLQTSVGKTAEGHLRVLSFAFFAIHATIIIAAMATSQAEAGQVLTDPVFLSHAAMMLGFLTHLAVYPKPGAVGDFMRVVSKSMKGAKSVNRGRSKSPASKSMKKGK